jgi:transcriptional regulator with XRE-family HTH domain
MDEKSTKILSIMAANIKRLRGNESQALLAKRAGISRQTISRYEAAKGRDIFIVDKIAAALGVDIDFLCQDHVKLALRRITAEYINRHPSYGIA